MLNFRFSADLRFIILLCHLLCICGALCPSEIPFGKITSTCTRVLNERCIYTCYHGHQYPDHERSLRWATCSQDPDTLEYVWNVPATAVCKAGVTPPSLPDNKPRLNAFKISSIVVGTCVLIPCVWVIITNIRKRRKRRQFRGSTLHLQRSNAAISGSGDDVQHGVFSVADNPIFNNDQLNQSHWFREIHLQSSVSYPLTIKNSEIVKPPDYSEIDFKDQKSPPSYTETMTAYSSK